MTRRSPILGSDGFTVVELLVTALISSVVLAGYVGMAGFQVSATRDQSNQVNLQQSVRSVAELFAREVRRSGANPTCSTAFDTIEFANSWQINLKSDHNGNGVIDATGDEYIVYQYLPTDRDFRRIANGRVEILLDDVQWGDSQIRYFDKDGNRLVPGLLSSGLSRSQRSKVRRIEFVLDVTQGTTSGQQLASRASSDVTLRNRFFIGEAGC